MAMKFKSRMTPTTKSTRALILIKKCVTLLYHDIVVEKIALFQDKWNICTHWDDYSPHSGFFSAFRTFILCLSQTVIVSYKNISAPQSFILRYSAAKLVWYLLDILGSCCRTNSMRISGRTAILALFSQIVSNQGGINAFVGFIFNNLEAFDAHINQHDANDDDQLVRTNYWLVERRAGWVGWISSIAILED